MKQDQNQDSQQPADPQRRQLLANLIAGGVVLTGAGAAAVAAERKGKGGKAGGKGGKGGRGGRGQQADPLKIASQLLDTYDQDGDNALNLDELKTAMAALYQVQGSGSSQGRGGKAGKGGKGGKARKGKGESQSSGGVTPKKPGEE